VLVIIVFLSGTTLLAVPDVTEHARRLRGRIASFSESVNLRRFERATRRTVERVELPYWSRRVGSFVRESPEGLRIGFVDGYPEREMRLLLRPAGLRDRNGTPRFVLEVRVDGRVIAALAGVTDAEIGQWREHGRAGREVLMGVVVTLDAGGEMRHGFRFRFGTPGGTL
jgi:hypothetical protein